ncbi:MAG: hypothetical protein Q4E48_13050 [Prevotella sp.]|nr:hypothetical protein [Prevotella sp.]
MRAINLTNNEFKRLLDEMVREKKEAILQKVDVTNRLSVLDEACSW